MSSHERWATCIHTEYRGCKQRNVLDVGAWITPHLIHHPGEISLALAALCIHVSAVLGRGLLARHTCDYIPNVGYPGSVCSLRPADQGKEVGKGGMQAGK